jgi:hypothetical protein
MDKVVVGKAVPCFRGPSMTVYELSDVLNAVITSSI